MKNKWYVVILSSLFFLVSCNYNSEDYKQLQKDYVISSKPVNDETSSKSNNSDDFYQKTSPIIDNKTPYQNLLTKEVDIHYFMKKYCLQTGVGGAGKLEDIVSDIGIECLRETGAGALYSIHKVKQGGLLYIFYMNRLPDASNYHPVIRCFYMRKKLSSEAFNFVKEGTTINEIKKIDPIAQVWENIYYADSEWWEATGGCGTFHYLSDGILEIGFKKQDGELKVFAKHLTQDFEMPQFSGKSYPYNGKILDSDWPK